MGSGKYSSLWRRPRTGPSSKNDCSSSSSSSSCSCTISFDFAFEVETQVTIFGESAGGWSVSHQLVRSSFLIRQSFLFMLSFLPANFVCSVFCIVLFVVLGAFLIVVSFQTQVNPAAKGLFRGKQVFLGLQ